MEKESQNIFEGAAGLYETLKEIEALTLKAELRLRDNVRPLRQSLIKRFPVFFLLLVTVGFTAVSFGLEHVFAQYSFFEHHPYVVLFLGICILVGTGAAYKSK